MNKKVPASPTPGFEACLEMPVSTHTLVFLARVKRKRLKLF